MTRSVPPSTPDPRQVLERQFIRLFGHAPTPEELERYRRALTLLSLRRPGRLRRGAARFITRW